MFKKDRTDEKNKLVSESTGYINGNPSSYTVPKRILDWAEDHPSGGWWAVRKLKKANAMAKRESRTASRYSACVHSLVSGMEDEEDSKISKLQKKYLSAIQRGRLGSAESAVRRLTKMSEVAGMTALMDVTVQPSTLSVGANECLVLLTSRTERTIVVTRIDITSKGAVVDVSPNMSKPIQPKSQADYSFTISPVMPGPLTVMVLVRYSDQIREKAHKASFSLNVVDSKDKV